LGLVDPNNLREGTKMKKIEIFAERVFRDTLDHLNKQYPTTNGHNWEKDARTTIKPGKKYTKVDVGQSGKYMVINATGEIYGIKAYGVIHKGHKYGNLDTIDQYYWGRYSAIKL
jgi:hypothetical protein